MRSWNEFFKKHNNFLVTTKLTTEKVMSFNLHFLDKLITFYENTNLKEEKIKFSNLLKITKFQNTSNNIWEEDWNFYTKFKGLKKDLSFLDFFLLEQTNKDLLINIYNEYEDFISNENILLYNIIYSGLDFKDFRTYKKIYDENKDFFIENNFPFDFFYFFPFDSLEEYMKKFINVINNLKEKNYSIDFIKDLKFKEVNALVDVFNDYFYLIEKYKLNLSYILKKGLFVIENILLYEKDKDYFLKNDINLPDLIYTSNEYVSESIKYYKENIEFFKNYMTLKEFIHCNFKRVKPIIEFYRENEFFLKSELGFYTCLGKNLETFKPLVNLYLKHIEFFKEEKISLLYLLQNKLNFIFINNVYGFRYNKPTWCLIKEFITLWKKFIKGVEFEEIPENYFTFKDFINYPLLKLEICLNIYFDNFNFFYKKLKMSIKKLFYLFHGEEIYLESIEWFIKNGISQYQKFENIIKEMNIDFHSLVRLNYGFSREEYLECYFKYYEILKHLFSIYDFFEFPTYKLDAFKTILDKKLNNIKDLTETPIEIIREIQFEFEKLKEDKSSKINIKELDLPLMKKRLLT